MIICFLIIIPCICLFVKLILFFIVCKCGKISYNGFNAFGFAYNKKKDYFYAVKNAWQKRFGYTHLYDVGAPLFRMIIDREPVHFYYNNKNWLLEFWKGQYGITTGAEIGIYNTNEQEVSKNTLYLPVKDNELLDMTFILYRRDKEIIKAHSKHWWLAVFKLGMFSKPKDLIMDVKITFPNREMLDAFLEGFKKLGYKKRHYKVIDKTFIFEFRKPRCKKVWTRSVIGDAIINFLNHQNVKRYNRYISNLITNDDCETFLWVQDLIPDLFKNDVANTEIASNLFLNKDMGVIVSGRIR